MEIQPYRRFRYIIVLMAFFFSLLVFRIAMLMFFSDFSFSSPNPEAKLERGFIMDRNGERLAFSLQTYSVYARPKEIESKKEVARKIAPLLNTDYQTILSLLNRKKPFIWLMRQVDPVQAKNLENINIQGIYLEKEYKRYYPFGNLASHIIGFSGVDNTGLEGIEYYFDSVLLPSLRETEESGTFNFQRGGNVVLTIDRYVQEIVEEEIQKAMEETKARRVTVIVMNPKTGEILAMANKPDYDLNNFINYTEEVKRNKAITDIFEPGSTFKIFIASILLDKGIVDQNEIFLCKGAIKVEGVVIRDSGIHGELSFREVLERSCNVGMIKAVSRIDRYELYDNLRAFGFGTPTGINLAGEASGILRNPASWSGISKYEISIGQEVAVTSLQLISAASAIANNGILMQPRIVKLVEDPHGKVLKEYKPLEIRRVISEDTASKMLAILKGVLSESGTGYKAAVEGYAIAGKTGTAQIADNVKGGYLEGQFYASFVGFVPVPDPRIVVLVTLDRPLGEVYGGQTAAPVFRKIVSRIGPYFNILPSFSEVYILKNEK